MTDNIALWRLAYVLPNLLAACGMALVAAQAWHFRKQRGGWALWVFAVSAAIWAFTKGLSFVGFSPDLSFFYMGPGPYRDIVCAAGYGGVCAGLHRLWPPVDTTTHRAALNSADGLSSLRLDQ